ncbi:MAG: universal stress protein UspA, partial [Ilumatobacteraceae bacterium]|nr:universal stress protein UspA [Ilumatobacteraceae bacterium]
HELFGDAAEYFVTNVGFSPLTPTCTSGWGIATPVTMPFTLPKPIGIVGADVDAAGQDVEGQDVAQQRATEVADQAALHDAHPLGDTGDPAVAILDAAHEHGVDVIVVGSHHTHWFDRLLTGSVSRELLRGSDVPVLVVP